MQSSLVRGVLLVSVALSIAVGVFAEPSDRLLEVDSLIRLHQRVNVRAGNKVPTSPGTPRPLSQPPSPTTTTVTAPSLVHSSSSSTTLNTDPTLRSSTSSSSSITLKKENVHSHDHGKDKDKDKGKEEHKPEDHTHNPDDIVAHDIGTAELKAIHEIMDNLFPEEAHIEEEAKAFELQKAQLKLDNLKKPEIKSKSKGKRKTEKKPTHGFSTPVLGYLQGIWSSHKSTKKLRTYYSQRVANVNSQIDFALHEWLVTQQKKLTARQRSALVAFLAYELRHRARLVTRWVQDVSGSSCQVKFVASARKRDQKEYGHPDGPTFGWLVTRKIKSIKGSCKKLNSKFPSTDDDFILVYESIVKSSKKPNGFLNFVLNVGGSKKTKKSDQFVHPISTSTKRKFDPLEPPSSPESPTPTSPLLTDFKFEDFEEPCSKLEHSELLLLEHVMDVQIKELISEEDISCDTSTTSLLVHSSTKDSPRKK